MKKEDRLIQLQSVDPRDQALIEELSFQLTGSRPDSIARIETCWVNLLRRMRVHGTDDLRHYLSLARDSDHEYGELISALTIHTTSWFRERPHFEKLLEIAKQHGERSQKGPVFKVLSAACSSGEEVYTMALVLETLRSAHPHFDYTIEGWDIDPMSVEKAQLAVYDQAHAHQIPKEYAHLIISGQGRGAGLFTLKKSIRQRCSFARQSLDLGSHPVVGRHYDVIFCRNVLIYFTTEQVEGMIRGLMRLLLPAGRLFLGHSEGIEASKFGLKSLGGASYQVAEGEGIDAAGSRSLAMGRSVPAKRILVVDGSPIAKMALRRALESKACSVVFASSVPEASTILRRESFDQMLIDLSLITRDHSHWVEEQRRKGTLASVVVMGSSSGADAQSALVALEHGAEEFIDKRTIISAPDAVAQQLLALLQTSHAVDRRAQRSSEARKLILKPARLILIGASTGGTEALLRLLKDMPRPSPPVVVVQHIATAFAKSFAERLSQVSGLQLGSPLPGSEVKAHHLYMAWDDYHIGLKNRGGVMQIETSVAPPLHSVRPAVDYLFESALQLKDVEHVAGIILTGMGKDGARGLLQLKTAGAMTMTQDEASCVVYGMPGEAVALGASNFSGSPEQIRAQLNHMLSLARDIPRDHKAQ